MIVTITQEEMDRVTALYDAPRKELRNYMDSLGEKYGYKPETAVINPNSLSFEAEPVE